jgi:hypothetical protein
VNGADAVIPFSGGKKFPNFIAGAFASTFHYFDNNRQIVNKSGSYATFPTTVSITNCPLQSENATSINLTVTGQGTATVTGLKGGRYFVLMLGTSSSTAYYPTVKNIEIQDNQSLYYSFGTGYPTFAIIECNDDSWQTARP